MNTRRNRLAARVLVLDPLGHLLLFRFDPPDRPPLWATVGGELDEGEDFAAGASRELFEETGLALDVGVEIARSESDFVTFGGEPVHAVERFFVVRVADRAIDTVGHSAQERAIMRTHRWWSVDEIRTSSETIYPAELADILASALETV